MDDLIYARPKAKHFQVHKVLHRLGNHQEELEAFERDRSGWLDQFPISHEDRALMEQLDFETMVSSGFHPILVRSLEMKFLYGFGNRPAEGA